MSDYGPSPEDAAEADPPFGSVPMARDANSDTRYGANASSAPEGRGGTVYTGLDFPPSTLEDTAMRGGWQKKDTPVPVPDTMPLYGGGMRGEPDTDSDAGEKPYPANGT